MQSTFKPSVNVYLSSDVALQDVPFLYAELLNPSHYTFDPASLWFFAAAAIAGCAGILTLRRERGSRASRLFAMFSFLFLAFSIGRGMLHSLDEPELVLFLARRTYIFIMLGAAVAFHFATVMLRTETRRKNVLRLSWITAIVIVVASFTTEWVIAGVTQFYWGLEPTYGAIGYFSAAWVLMLMATSAYDAVRAWSEAEAGSQERRRVATFSGALLLLYCSFVDFLPAMGFEVYPFAVLPITLFTIFTGILTYRFGLVEYSPKVAAQQIAEMMGGALLILDPEGVVQYANKRCRSVLGWPGSALLGRRARNILGDAFEPTALAALVASDDREIEKEWTHSNPDTGKSLDLAMSAMRLEGEHHRELATVCVMRDVSARKRARLDQDHANLHDPLTSLPNRAMFVGLLDAAVQRARDVPHYTYAICFVALDRMRIINEDLGNAAGDRVLSEVSTRLRHSVRPQDTVARIGGDEFGILLRGHEGESEVRDMATRLLAAIRLPMKMDDHELFLAASVGAVIGEPGPTNGAELLRRASMAMYQAKNAGGGSLQFASAANTVSQRTRLESDLRHALENNELEVHYQPIVDLLECRVSGFEALVRWQHPKRGLLEPVEFIDFAEEAGLLGAIDIKVLNRACSDLREFQQTHGDTHISMSVNLGEEGIRDPQLVERIQNLLLTTGLHPQSLRVELLERVALVEPLREPLNRLRAMGVGLYVDDFGTGYSALARLHELPVTAVKIDRDFVRAMSLGMGGEKTIRGILALSRSLSLGVIAEGCATAAEVRKLHEMGCRHVQGFYFSKAVPFEAAMQLAGDPEVLAGKFERLNLPPPQRRDPEAVAGSRPKTAIQPAVVG